MNNRYTNRIDMCRTVIALLDDPAHLAAWQGPPPLQFGTKAASLRVTVEAFAATASRQSAVITGAALDKERNEALLEDLAHELGSLLADDFHDENREQAAPRWISPSARGAACAGEHLLNRAGLLATTLAGTLSADAAALSGYGLTPDDSIALAAVIDAYRDSIAQPSGAIAERKTLTASLDGAYRAVAILLDSMDRLVPRLRRRLAGGPHHPRPLPTRPVRLAFSADQIHPDPTMPIMDGAAAPITLLTLYPSDSPGGMGTFPQTSCG